MSLDISEETTNQSDAHASEKIGGRPNRLKRQRSKKRGPRWLRRISGNLRMQLGRLLILLIVVAIVVMVGGLVVATDTTSRVEASFATLNRVLGSTFSRPGTELTLDDFNKLRLSLQDVISTISSARRQANIIRPILNLNNDLDTTLTYLDVADQLARSADALLEGLQPTLFFLVGGQDKSAVTSQISSGERIVELLSIGRPGFINAEAYLINAKGYIDSINSTGLSADKLLQLEQLRGYQKQLGDIQLLLMSAPDLLESALGLTSEKSYLVLSENSDEIRPSGGYLSTYGWFVVRNGSLVDYNYSATTATNPNPPPASFGDQVQVPSWWLQYENPVYAAWDGSWSPDFSSTAERAMWFYNNGNNPHSPVEGAISIDIVAFEYILKALGQVSVPEFNRVVNSDNFRQAVYDIRASGVAEGQPDSPHKQFLAALYRQIFTDWQATASDPQKSAAILGALLQALQEKHIMIYSADPGLNQVLDLLGWSGRQTDAIGLDYLMVVDANLGNKSNSSIRRQTTMDVEINADGSAFNRATINYDYSDSVASLDPAVNPEFHGPLTYNNLLQVFVPVGAELTEQVGDFIQLEQYPSDINTLFTSLLTVPYNTSQRFQLAYTSPNVVESIGEYKRYTLIIQKQPGMRSEVVNLQISLPSDASLVSTAPTAAASYSIDRQILEFRLDLVGDTQVEIVYQMN